MQTPSTSTLTLLALLPLIAWRVYARFRRMVGRQRLSKRRPWITLVVFPTIVTLLAVASGAHPQQLVWLATALCFGALLGVFGLRHTRFEPTKQGLFYTPNAHLGIALSLLFVARIIYRFVELYLIEPGLTHATNDFARSPLTLAVFGLLAGYYMSYAVGLLRWRFRVVEANRQRKAATTDA